MALTSFGQQGLVNLPGLQQIPYGARVFYVHASGGQAFQNLPSEITDTLATSIATAIDWVENDRGDIIQLLPGHAESITASYLSSTRAAKRGYTIRGPGMGKPAVLTWSAAGSTFAPTGADVVIDGGRGHGRNPGIILNLEPGAGTVTVAAPITLGGARQAVRNCQMRTGTDANNLVTNAITVAGVADVAIENNLIWGAAAAVSTTIIKDSTAACDRIRIIGNYIDVAIATAATGVLIDLSTTAGVGIQIGDNILVNRTATSKFVGKLHASTSGMVFDNRIKVDDTATAITSLGFTPIGSNNVLVGYANNRIVDDDGLADGLMGTASS